MCLSPTSKILNIWYFLNDRNSNYSRSKFLALLPLLLFHVDSIHLNLLWRLTTKKRHYANFGWAFSSPLRISLLLPYKHTHSFICLLKMMLICYQKSPFKWETVRWSACFLWIMFGLHELLWLQGREAN